jgi:hypothetical protein
MSLSRYFLDIEDRVPVSAFAVLERGAVVNGDQAAVNTVTVHEGHDFAASDKFIYALARDNIRIDRIFTVSSVTATTVVFSGATFSFPDKALLINLGVDTGGVIQNDGSYSKLEYDAAAITVYKDPAGDAAWTNSQVDVDPGGEVGFYGDGRVVWGVALDTGGRGIRIYPDVGSAAASAARGTSLPSDGTPGQLFILDGGAGVADIVYIRVEFSDDTFDWLELGNAV